MSLKLDGTGKITGIDQGLSVVGVTTLHNELSVSGDVGIGTFSKNAKLTINPLTTLPNIRNADASNSGGISIPSTENKTYPTDPSFVVNLGLNQNIELGGTQVINSSTPGGFNYISGIRNYLYKDKGNTQDIDRSYYYGLDQRFSWSDLNTCKQYISVFDSFVYGGIDANGRTSGAFNVDRLILLPPEGGQQTISNVTSKLLQLRGNGAAGISTISITDATGYVPNLSLMNFNLGTHNYNITNYSAFKTNRYWGTQGSLGTLNATITNYYGLHLNEPYGSTGLTITNNYGVYSGWSESKNYFAGSVGIGTDIPTDVLDISTGSGDEVTSLKVKTQGRVELSRNHSSAPYIKTLMNSGNPNIILGDNVGDRVLINGHGPSYFNGGNVGIGSEIPGTKLDVLGDIRASSTTNYLGGLRIANFTGYTQGFSSFNLDVSSVDAQTSFFVIAGFNHYGLYSYGCSTVRHVTTGPNFTQEIIQDQTSGPGGSWTASKVTQTTIRITKNAGTYNGGGYYFVSVYAAT